MDDNKGSLINNEWDASKKEKKNAGGENRNGRENR